MANFCFSMSFFQVKNQLNPSASLFRRKIFKLGDQILFFRSFLLKLICLCISDDLEIEDVQLKYKKRGGEIWVSLDQYKLSSPSNSKTPSNAKQD